MEQLQQWKQQIQKYPKLSFLQAKELYEQGKEEEVILGTLHVIYQYLKSNQLHILQNGTYDMNDIINTFCEEWIRAIRKGRLEEVKGFYEILDFTFVRKIVKKLSPNENGWPKRFDKNIYVDIFLCYIDLKNQKDDISYDDLLKKVEQHEQDKKNNFGSRKLDSYQALQKNYKLFDFCENLYQKLNIDSSKDVKFSRRRLTILLPLLLDIGFLTDLKEADVLPYRFEDEIINKVAYERIVQAICQSTIDPKAKQIFLERTVLYDKSTYENLAKKYNSSVETVRKYEQKALRKVRKEWPIKKTYIQK